jgi:hypothetical protein
MGNTVVRTPTPVYALASTPAGTTDGRLPRVRLSRRRTEAAYNWGDRDAPSPNSSTSHPGRGAGEWVW